MRSPSIIRNSILFALLALCAAALINATWQLTKGNIERQKRDVEEKGLLEIIPASRHDNMLLDDTITVGPQDAGLGLRGDKCIYIARQNGRVVAVIIPAVAPDGYAGNIDLMVGIYRDGSIAGIRVLAQSETPGLGDRVDARKSDWLLAFIGRSLSDPLLHGWAVKKDNGAFDQLTGATVTSRAVVAATLRTLQFAEANWQKLFGEAGPAPAGGGA